jgi:putative tryptophan/tyrosine transport system substrate-binding protein
MAMRRREAIVILGGAAIAWPLAASAQEATRTYRVGGVSISPRTNPYFVAMFDELRRLGFVEGRNLTVDWRAFGPNIDRIPEFVSELVKAQVDVLYVTGDLAIRAAQRATTTIPILGASEDMVGLGLVHSLAHPAGNTTGISILTTELDGKRQEILMEAVPGRHRMAALADSNATTPLKLQALHDAARERGVELSIHKVTRAQEIPTAIDEAKASGAEALNVLASPVLYTSRQVIIDRVAVLRLPAIYQFPDAAVEGGFIAYGPTLLHIYRELMAPQIAKVLHGTKPADLPVLQPTKFELVINLKTAKALGLTIPETFLQRADKVIE